MKNSVNLEVYTYDQLMFESLVHEFNPAYILTDKYEVGTSRDLRIGSVFAEKSEFGDNTIVYTRLDLTLVCLRLFKNTLTALIYAHDEATARKVLAQVKERIPETVANSEQVNVRFWMLGQQGPTSVTRTIEVPEWSEIEENYEKSTRSGLDALIHRFTPEGGGKIILWHGNPGTGKTYALRALAKEWRKWSSVDYILDPEILFGGNPSYLANMVFDTEQPMYFDDEGDPIEDEDSSPASKWKLFILEDTGELLADDARQRTGQGLSRLLNVADGFIGQGLKVLFLITTNEEMSKLHPAVSREGRCAAAIHFNPLSREEALVWAGKNEVELGQGTNHDSYLLSNLYSLKNQKKITIGKENERPFGFVRR